MIYLTCDTHGKFERLGSNYFDAQNGDYVIICGDFCNLCDNSKTEEYWRSGYDKSHLQFFLLTAITKITICLIRITYRVDGGKVQRLPTTSFT